MTPIRKTKLLIWITALTLILACVPSLTTNQSIPTMDPGAINTFIVQTAHAAATQTAAKIPTATQTPTIEPTRNTETPTLTATSTVIFVFLPPTSSLEATQTGGSSSDNFACQFIKVSPPNGSPFRPRQEFTVAWTVQNIGKKQWDHDLVTYVYSIGTKMHTISSYNLSKSVPSGGQIDLTANMRAPKQPGSYTTTWIMRTGNKQFCPLNFSIVVQQQ